jgi:hypothetical protein
MIGSAATGSFRDPSGFVFLHEGLAYRQVNAGFGEAYRRLMGSGLYDDLVSRKLLIAHREVDLRLDAAPKAEAVLLPEQIPFVSYPYEWSFSQLKTAALLTLEVARRAIERGQILRDASAYNVQFVGTRPVFIDTLSFGEYAEGQPWRAYRQFCAHFLAPLALMAHIDPSLGELSRTHLDGVPLPLASRLLPLRTHMKPGLLMHLHLHGRQEVRTESSPETQAAASRPSARMTRTALLGLFDSLKRTVAGLDLPQSTTLWSTYGSHLNYSPDAQARKRELVASMIDKANQISRVNVAWDMGANTGEYSAVVADTGARVISFDGDHAVVEHHYRSACGRSDERVLPLLQNFANPSPSIGWDHSERRSLAERGPADLALALALVHHLTVAGNVPLAQVAHFFSRICRHLVIEFVPKEDSQVRRMLALREDTFGDYSIEGFELAFARYFHLVERQPIEGTVRTLYLMTRR